MKCVDSCWYCSGKCDNCLETTSFDRGPVLGYHFTEAIRFCNEECLKHYRFHKSSSHTQILFHKRISPPDHAICHEHFLTVTCGLPGISLERNKVIAQFYHSSSQEERIYVLLQIRFVPKQRFLAFVPSDDFLPLACLPNPMPLTDEDMLIICGLHLVMKGILAKLNFPDLVSCATSILNDKGSTSYSGQILEVPPLQPSIDALPSGFKISLEDQAIIYPHPYCIALHQTTKTYTTYLLADLTTQIDGNGRFLVLFYNYSIDCTIKIVYAVEDSQDTISVKILSGPKSQPLLNPYDEQLVEICKTIVCVELLSMLERKGFDHLGDCIINYKCVTYACS